MLYHLNRQYSILIYNVFYTYCFNRLYSVNSTFIYTGKGKKFVTCFTAIFALQTYSVSEVCQ